MLTFAHIALNNFGPIRAGFCLGFSPLLISADNSSLELSNSNALFFAHVHLYSLDLSTLKSESC